MKVKTTLPVFLTLLWLSSCGPAAEDREQMYVRARVFQDSIANVIRNSMKEVEELTKWPYVNATAAPTSTADSSLIKNKK